MTQGRTKIIACRTVIKEMQHLVPSGIEALTLDSGLHFQAEKLQGKLQAMIDKITGHTETIILGYRLIFMGVLCRKETGSDIIT